MDRRGFLLGLAELTAFLAVARALPPVPAEAVVEPLPEALPFTVIAAAEDSPFFWESEIVEGILAAPLLDLLIASDRLVDLPLGLR